MLVDYSDSDSESELEAVQVIAPAPKLPTGPTPSAKPGFQKASGKIKVDLPTIRPEPGAVEDLASEPPVKRARTGGAFSGINNFLPAPKRTAQNAPKKGVSLKTSGEAAFSRETPSSSSYTEPVPSSGGLEDTSVVEKKEEPKLVGKATRFLPLSVSNKKKKKKPALPPTPSLSSNVANIEEAASAQPSEPEPRPKPKRSLFSVQEDEPTTLPIQSTGAYEPLMTHEKTTASAPDVSFTEPKHLAPLPDANSLEAAASDLDLTPAQRRHLFGRGGKDVKVTHFDMDSEYKSNEQMRQAGEVFEHRAVKAIAPGKHSLQQLVNNAQTQKDGLEDAWAEGKRNRGEGASKYGWGK